jgi:hypothetical protein
MTSSKKRYSIYVVERKTANANGLVFIVSFERLAHCPSNICWRYRFSVLCQRKTVESHEKWTILRSSGQSTQKKDHFSGSNEKTCLFIFGCSGTRSEKIGPTINKIFSKWLQWFEKDASWHRPLQACIKLNDDVTIWSSSKSGKNLFQSLIVATFLNHVKQSTRSVIHWQPRLRTLVTA